MSGKNQKTGDWQNRIVGEGMVAAGELLPHWQNWRRHPARQAEVLAQTLGGVGWVQRVIVNRRSGRMLDGHLRAELARKQGEETPVPVVYVDLSEDEERAVLATLDPIAGMAIADEETLAGLVRSIEDADLRSVAGEMAQTMGAQVGDGVGREPGAGFSYREQYGVIVVCADEAHQKTVYDDLVAAGLTCKVVTT